MAATSSSTASPQRSRQAAGRRLPVGRLIAGYLAVICVGIALLRAPGMLVRGNELSMTEAIFAAVNAATLTGFEPQTTLAQYTFAGRCVLLGLIVCGTLVSLIAGGVLVVRIVRLPFDERRLARRAVAFVGAGTAVGTALLWDGQRTAMDALFLAISAIGNCGLACGPQPAVDDWRTHAVILPLAFAGALGVPVILELIAAWRRHGEGLSTHSRIALAWMLGVYVIGTVLMWAIGTGSGASLRDGLISASAASLDARTAGFGFESPERWARAMQWVVMMLMMIGGASGGAAGGIKVTTCAQIARGARRLLAGDAPGRAMGIALIWVGIYVAIVLGGMLILLGLQPQIPADRLLFEVISATSNAGLSYGPISMVGPSMYTLCALMLAGRLLPLAVLLWLARTTRDAEIAVG